MAAPTILSTADFVKLRKQNVGDRKRNHLTPAITRATSRPNAF